MAIKKIVIALLISACAYSNASAATVTIDYRDGPFNQTDVLGALDAFIGPSITADGVTVTGSANIGKLEFNGMGVVGAGSDFSVDPGEFLEFTFNNGPASAVSYLIQSAADGDPNGLSGERIVEAWNENGNFLGAFSQNGLLTFDLSALFNFAIISRFRLTGSGRDNFSVASLTYDTIPQIPLPAALPLFLAGLAGLGLAKSHQKKSATSSSRQARSIFELTK